MVISKELHSDFRQRKTKNPNSLSFLYSGHDETLKLLIDRGANLHSANKLYGESALHKAAYKGKC